MVVAAEVAVSVVLICGAFLLFQSLMRLQRVDFGARVPTSVMHDGDPILPWDRYSHRHRRAAFSGAGRARPRHPGVESAAVSAVPLEAPAASTASCPAGD